MYLKKESFRNIVKFSPIAAIDLCILNKSNEILLGKRINPPAKNLFFVPGGRIRKGETLFIATKRILNSEISYDITKEKFNKINLLGVFEHFYEDNFTGDNSFSSHYIVIAYKIPLDIINKSKSNILNNQHEEYIWYNKKNFNDKDIKIHTYSKAYIEKLYKNYS